MCYNRYYYRYYHRHCYRYSYYILTGIGTDIRANNFKGIIIDIIIRFEFQEKNDFVIKSSKYHRLSGFNCNIISRFQ